MLVIRDNSNDVIFGGGVFNYMSFFKKALAKVGIGSVTVDTRLFEDDLNPGELIKGVVHIHGGKVEQEVNELYLKIYTQFLKKDGDNKTYVTYPLVKYRLTESFTVIPNSTNEIPFSVQLPFFTPITVGKIKVWVQTELDISNAIDPNDRDYINVIPSTLCDEVFQSLSDLGFRLREAECITAPSKFPTSSSYVQEFEFIPVRGPFVNKLDELEVVILSVNENEVDILLEIDRKARNFGGFLSEMLELDESHVRLTITKANAHDTKDIIYNLIQKYC
ncbi:MAG: sporulation protein SpoOM [Bacillales bacterium]|jgi:sporulation-control protein|nr:sporulation protein SpoOM [Bacillales bacterium]